MMTLEDFKAARKVLDGVIAATHLIPSPAFSKATGNHVYLKPENMQITGAYKLRGAYFKISTLTDEEKARGLITASAGNRDGRPLRRDLRRRRGGGPTAGKGEGLHLHPALQ